MNINHFFTHGQYVAHRAAIRNKISSDFHISSSVRPNFCRIITRKFEGAQGGEFTGGEFTGGEFTGGEFNASFYA